MLPSSQLKRTTHSICIQVHNPHLQVPQIQVRKIHMLNPFTPELKKYILPTFLRDDV